MSLDTQPYEDDIKAQVETVCPRVFVTQVPDSTTTPPRPYAILRWIEPIRTGFDHHMESARRDTQRAGLVVTIVSDTDASANVIKNRIRGTLTGYRPPDCGEMICEGGLAYSRANTNPKPTTYSRELYYSFVTNLSWE